MLTEGQYNSQLPILYNRLSHCYFIKSITQSITKSSQHIITGTSSITKDETHVQLHFLIRYNANYSSPTLLFQVYKPTESIESGILVELSKITYQHSDIERLIRDKRFKYTLTQIDHEEGGGNWWFIHPCNIKELVQEIEENNEASWLINWFSVYGGVLFDIRVDELLGC